MMMRHAPRKPKIHPIMVHAMIGYRVKDLIPAARIQVRRCKIIAPDLHPAYERCFTCKGKLTSTYPRPARSVAAAGPLRSTSRSTRPNSADYPTVG